MAKCESTRYAPGECSETPPRYMVVYLGRATGRVLDSATACFRHGTAEVDRHIASGGIALCELRSLKPPVPPPNLMPGRVDADEPPVPLA